MCKGDQIKKIKKPYNIRNQKKLTEEQIEKKLPIDIMRNKIIMVNIIMTIFYLEKTLRDLNHHMDL